MRENERERERKKKKRKDKSADGVSTIGMDTDRMFVSYNANYYSATQHPTCAHASNKNRARAQRTGCMT
jgi:hypothetical protein